MCSNMSGGNTEEEKFTQFEFKMSREKLGSTTLQVGKLASKQHINGTEAKKLLKGLYLQTRMLNYENISKGTDREVK